LENLRDIALVLLLGGPLACLIAATVGVSALVLSGAVPVSEAVYNWLTWWVGDTIGVMVFAPILLLLANREVSRPRQIGVALSLVLIFSLVIAMFFFARHQEQVRTQLAFQNRAQAAVTGLQSQIDQYLTLLHDAGAMFRASEQITREEFREFTRDLSKMYPGLLGLSWSQRVAANDRKAYEAATRAEGFPDFAIREGEPTQPLLPAAARAEYFPVTYIEPYRNAVPGFDDFGESERRRAIGSARDRNELVATGRISLLQANQDNWGVLVFAPIYQREVPLETLEQRQQNIRGLVAAAFYLPRMLANSLDGRLGAALDIAILDDAAARDSSLLYESSVGVGKRLTNPGNIEPMLWREQISVASRSWTIQVAPAAASVVPLSWTVWTMLTAGLMFTSLFGVFALMASAQSDVVRRLVAQRTDELSRSRADLHMILEGATDAIV